MDADIEKYLRGLRDAEMPAIGKALSLLGGIEFAQQKTLVPELERLFKTMTSLQKDFWDANGMDRPRSRPQRLSECVGGLSGTGAPPCLAGPPFAQSPPSALIWVRTHFTWSASIRGVPSYCESGSRAGASHQGLRTSHPV
jgi:hypothetical protein